MMQVRKLSSNYYFFLNKHSSHKGSLKRIAGSNWAIGVDQALRLHGIDCAFLFFTQRHGLKKKKSNNVLKIVF